jgi:hypothetical protein
VADYVPDDPSTNATTIRRCDDDPSKICRRSAEDLPKICRRSAEDLPKI